MNIASYFAAYRETPEAVEAFREFCDEAPEGNKIFNVMRYRGLLPEKRISGLNLFYLYENFEELTDEEIHELENFIGKPFSYIRQMHTLTFVRYPNKIKGLPDDRYFAQLVKAWKKFYSENKIELLMSGLMDDYPGFIGVEVAKAMGIPIVSAYAGGRFTLAYVLTDSDFIPIFYNKLKPEEADKKYQEALEMMNKEGVTNQSIVALADSYFNFFNPSAISKNIGALNASFIRYYFQLPEVERKIWLSPIELFWRQFHYFKNSKISRLFFNKKPIPGQKYVFFPIHFSRDAAIKAITPLVDQIRLIEDISKVLPSDTTLYVKPHPHWKCSDISVRDMRHLAKLPKVRLLDYNCSTKELIKGSQYVIIINSSVGFEAIVQKHKVVSFGAGYPKGVIPRLSHVQDLMRIEDFKMDWQACKEFIANSYSHAIFHDRQEWFDVGRWTPTFTERIYEESMKAREFLLKNRPSR
ncbi:MAG: hypothetical protein ABIH29_04395 [Candidatus Micrarchaeota archaeon]